MTLQKLSGPLSGYKGFTLIELMISLTIGVIVLTSATGLVVSSANARRIVKFSAELQEESFFVTHLLKQQLAQAGYRRIGIASTATRAIPIPNLDDHYPAVTGKWLSGQLINISAGALSFRFDGASHADGTADGSIYDCFGNAVPFGVVIESSIAMQGNSLICSIGTNTTPLIDGTGDTIIEQLVFTLGVDSNNDKNIDSTVDSSVATATDYSNARNLTIRMLLASRVGVIKHNQTYRFNGVDITATDNRLRTEAVVPVALRH